MVAFRWRESGVTFAEQKATVGFSDRLLKPSAQGRDFQGATRGMVLFHHNDGLLLLLAKLFLTARLVIFAIGPAIQVLRF